MSEIKDPVCGMEVEPGSVATTREYDGESFYFCLAGCGQKFDADPGRYVRQTRTENHGSAESPSETEHFHHHEMQASKADQGHNHEAQGTHVNSVAADQTPASKGIYTCPMHPEVVSDKPGNCPKCGKTLERP